MIGKSLLSEVKQDKVRLLRLGRMNSIFIDLKTNRNSCENFLDNPS